MRYLYQMNLEEFDSYLVHYLEESNYRNSIDNEYRNKIANLCSRLRYLFRKYSSEIRRLIEKESMKLENVNELLKLELYLFNILDVYQNDYIISEKIMKIEDIEASIHNIHADTLWAYFYIHLDRKDAPYKVIFSDLLASNKGMGRQSKDEKILCRQ